VPLAIFPRWPDDRVSKYKIRKFTREILVDFSLECRDAFGTIQANDGRWSAEASLARGDAHDDED
jgi:hypothetical protein